MKEFLIQDGAAFKLRAVIKNCLAPEDLKCVEFTGEQYDDEGELIGSSTYQFFLNSQELQTMSEGLVA